MEYRVEEFFENYQERVKKHYKRHLIAYKKSGVQNNNRVIAMSEQMIQFAGAMGYQMRAFAYLGNGDLNDAIKNMSLAIQDLPNVANFYTSRGAMYGEKGDFDNAIADIDKALRLEPDSADAYYQRSLAHLGKGKFELAFADCTKALSIGKSDTCKLEAYLIRGFLYGKDGEFDNAVSDFESALHVDVPNVGNNGSIYVEADYHDDARECLKYASMAAKLANEPGSPYHKLKEQRAEEKRQVEYNKLIVAKNRAETEKEYQDLAKRFREMNGYKNVNELAEECDRQYRILKEQRIEAEYNQLAESMVSASTEEEYQNLAGQFRAMNGYKDTAELSKECDNRYSELKEQRLEIEYNTLIEAKNKASTEEEYLSLAGQFRAMYFYKNTAKLSDECYNRYSELKELREEQERIERECREEQERKDIEKAQRDKRNRQIIGVMSVVALVFCAVTAYYLTRPTVESLFNTGRSYYDADNFSDAAKYFTKTVKRNPCGADFRYWRGMAYLGLEHYKAAAADFHEAARLAPDVVEYYCRMADAYSGMKDYDNVVKAYSQAIRLEPNNPEHYFNRAEANSGKKDYNTAIFDYTQAIRLDPSDPRFYNTIGGIYRQVEDYAQAIAYHTEAIRLNPSDARYHNNRGVAYHLSKNYPVAIANYTEAIRLAPDNARYYNNRGAVYSLSKNYAAAAEDFREALRLDPGSAQYRINLESAEEQQRKRQKRR